MSRPTTSTAKRSEKAAGADDTDALALRALGWIVNDPERISRFFAVTGLDPDNLRKRIADPALHQAIFAFLAAHEPDLLACAAELAVSPETLADPAREAAA
jgi:hypothetical protein